MGRGPLTLEMLQEIEKSRIVARELNVQMGDGDACDVGAHAACWHGFPEDPEDEPCPCWCHDNGYEGGGKRS